MVIKKYIKIVNYSSGPTLQTQLEDIEDMNLMDEGTRLFFDKHNVVTMKDMAWLMERFDAEVDSEFSEENVVFKPKAWYLSGVKG